MEIIKNRIPYLGDIKAPFDAIQKLMIQWKKDSEKLKDKLTIKGYVTLEHWRDGIKLAEESGFNLFTTEGMNNIGEIVFRATAKDSARYIGIYGNNVTPAAGNTAAVHMGAAGTYGAIMNSASGYDAADDGSSSAASGAHPLYTPAALSSALMTNSANKAHYVMATSKTVYAAYLTNTAATTLTNGVLYAAKKFTTARSVINNDELYVTYAVQLS